jgi:hypothetical protein
MQQTVASQALVTIFMTMPKKDQKAFKQWIIEHQEEIETETFKENFDSERIDFLKLSAYGLNRAYSDDEPEYTLEDCIELNTEIK